MEKEKKKESFFKNRDLLEFFEPKLTPVGVGLQLRFVSGAPFVTSQAFKYTLVRVFGRNTLEMTLHGGLFRVRPPWTFPYSNVWGKP